MENIYPCGLTATQVDEFKAKHGSLYVVSITDGENEYTAVCCEQTSKIASICSEQLRKGDEAGAMLTCYNNVVLAADDEIKKRDVLKVKVIEALNTEIGKITATAKKL